MSGTIPPSDPAPAPAPAPAPQPPPAPPPPAPPPAAADQGNLTLAAAARMMRAARQQAAVQAPQAQTQAQPPASAQTAPTGLPMGLFDPDPQAAAAFNASDSPDSAPDDPESAPTAPESAEPDPNAAAIDPNTRVRVKVNGQDHEVTLAEALAGYSRDQDYRQKSMRNAELQRTLDNELNATRQERQRAAQELDRALNEVSTLLIPEADLDRLLDTNPEAYHRERRRREKVSAAIEERVRLAEIARRDEYQQLARHTAEEAQKLFNLKPEWKNPDTYTKVQAEMRDYAVSQGFEHQDVNNVRDHRMMLILEKAMRYDKLLASRPTPVAPRANGATLSPAPLRPGTPPPRTNPAQAAVREARATFDEKPTLKSALAMLQAQRPLNGAQRR